MSEDPTVPANVRLSLSQRNRLDELADEGEFDSRTAAVQEAVDALLAEHDDKTNA